MDVRIKKFTTDSSFLTVMLLKIKLESSRQPPYTTLWPILLES
jgi:hypothetical protein